MESLFASRTYLVILGLFSINLYNGRRSITTNEFEKFCDAFLKELPKNGIAYYPDVDEDYMKYYDYIELRDGSYAYRLKPMYTKEDIIKQIHTIGIVKILSNKSLVENLNDMTLEDENNCVEFKRADEKHQLKKMHELLRLNQEIAIKEQELGFIRRNSISLASEETVERIFEETPFISLENLEKSYQSR